MTRTRPTRSYGSSAIPTGRWRSAVLRHLDRRAAVLLLGSAYEGWARDIAPLLIGHPLLTARLREWSLLRAITLKRAWHPADLLASSNWLQLKAAESSAEAAEILAEGGRTRRIRNSAKAARLRP
ncbi:hypothetical protein [Streptomyces murinus]|uniref:hypothetical protein n=1 Tax=Streptomyces murinus TaxID=33900 RepID=UPI00211469E9|nr:hypothetical protein [Streptomyces murinus]